jgi:anti-sigma B factor antagonist
MTELASLTIEVDEAVVVAHVEGEVDSSNAHALLDQIVTPVSNSAHGVVLDLTGLHFLDSAGVQVVFDLATGLSRRRQALAVVAPEPSSVRTVLELCALEQVAALTTGIDDASTHVREANEA